MFEHVFKGCAPVPLAGYLKALGVFRLVAEQADEDARGFWRDERFVLRTKLSEEELIAFFLDAYRPSPILSPWNAGSGFYYREGKSNEKDPATGKKIKTGTRDEATTATKAIDAVMSGLAQRFDALRESIGFAKAELVELGFSAAPTDDEKADLVGRARSTLPDLVGSWIDAAATCANDGLAFPPLLGSGGNDGNLDFSTTFVQTILGLMDPRSGEASAPARSQLEGALFGRSYCGAPSAAISQFDPQSSGGANAGNGFDGKQFGNPWDIVLCIEGSLALAGAASRRLGSHSGAGAAFPFMVPRAFASSGGAGHLAISDEASGRGEFWAPIWSRPATYAEMLALFREGRLVVQRRGARSSLDFARAIGELGVNRGIDHFARHAFQQRNGNMYYSVPLARQHVKRARNESADLIASLDGGDWLERISRTARGKTAPGQFAAAARRLDDALFRLAADGSREAVQGALIAVGRIALECARRPKLRSKDEKGRFPTTPPPLLSAEWRARADDGSADFALAAALAGLSARTSKEGDGAFYMPFRVHLAPIEAGKFANVWAETTGSRALALWTGRDLVRDLAAILERRLVEAQRHTFVDAHQNQELPLRGYPSAPLWAVAEFLAGRTDDQRIGELAAGLAWVEQAKAGQSAASSMRTERRDAIPLAFAAIKPLLHPAGAGPGLHRLGPKNAADMRNAGELRYVNPLAIIRLLSAGRIEDAARAAQRMARGAGLAAPFANSSLGGAIDPLRLAAAPLFPLSPKSYAALAERAYPSHKPKNQQEHAHAD